MKSIKCYEDYPYSFVIGSNLIQLLLYAIGAYIVYLLGPVWLALYIIFILILEIRLLKMSCINCYYYGKLCAFGRGKLCALLFKKGEPKKFIEKQITFKDIIPDFLVTMIPLIIGIYLLYNNFTWILLVLLIILVILGFPVTGYIRGSVACKHCKQREIGCPAEQFFQKKKK
jgi:hypothetical protein